MPCFSEPDYIAFSRFIIFEVKEGQDNYAIYELLPVLLLGVVGGLLGASLVSLNAHLATWRKHVLWPQIGPRGKIVEVLMVSLLTSAVSFSLPLLVRCQVSVTKDGWQGVICSHAWPTQILPERYDFK